MSGYNYTWEDVALGIDVNQEAIAEGRFAKDITRQQEKESTAMGGWSLGLSLLGALTLGPAGYFLGQQAGKYIGDKAYDWEGDIKDFDPGKFGKETGRRYKEDVETMAEEQNVGQIIGAVTDLASAYLMAGGFGKGDMDWTTFGSGEDQWKFFGRGTPGEAINTGQGYKYIEPSEDYIKGIWDSDRNLGSNLLNLISAGSTLGYSDPSKGGN